jgi:hypothetical protein
LARTPPVVDIDAVGPPFWRKVLLPLLLLLAIGAALWDYLSRTRQSTQPAAVAEATDVRSEVTRRGDSLDIAVAWRFDTGSARSVPESVRVEVGVSGTDLTSVATEAGARQADTLHLPTPEPGKTASGYSCVSAIHRGRLRGESCTPWQFVLPSAGQAADSGADTTAARAQKRRTATATEPRVVRFVVQPAGLQVDPDADGRCAAWQRDNPAKSVWIDVNRKAVPDCSGPNGKPTVAQFCAFAELADGRRIKTENSRNNPYCERLFQEWTAQRVS